MDVEYRAVSAKVSSQGICVGKWTSSRVGKKSTTFSVDRTIYMRYVENRTRPTPQTSPKFLQSLPPPPATPPGKKCLLAPPPY
jgi:hypothetical protein